MAAQKDAESIFAQIAIERGYMTAEEVEECRQVVRKLRELKLAPRNLTQIAIERQFITRAQVKAVNSEMRARGIFPRLGGFEIMGKIGSGGMGNVYKARQISLGRTVALKVLPRELANNPIYLERFKREARMAAQLTHANAILIYDVGEDGGRHFLVMEYVEGTALDKMLESGPIDEERALEIIRDIAKALVEAHSKSIIHRDIKPGNILVRHDGAAKLSDLGIAKDLGQGQAALTRTGVPLGTPAYMSPEQCRGQKDIDHRTDIYSLGVTLFHLVTGKMPFSGPTPLMVMRSHIDDEMPDPRKLNPEISDSTAELIMEMTVKDRDLRISDCNEIAKRIGSILGMRSGELDLDSQLEFALSPEEMASLEQISRDDNQRKTRSLRKKDDDKTRRLKKPAPLIITAAGASAVILILLALLVTGYQSRARKNSPDNEPVPVADDSDTDTDENNDFIVVEPPPELYIEMVSQAYEGSLANGPSFNPSVCSRARYIAFVSRATNLTPFTSSSDNWGIYVKDKQSGTVERLPVSIPANSGIPDIAPDISGDGRYVVFAENLPEMVSPNSENKNAFLYDRITRSTKLLSRSPDGREGDSDSDSPAISADGSYIVFASKATNLIDEDTGGNRQIYLFDRDKSEVQLVSRNEAGQAADADCEHPAISPDGLHIAFSSSAGNLAPALGGEHKNVFHYNHERGETRIITVGRDGSPANGDSCCPAISADGRFIAFHSMAGNLVARDFNRLNDVFVHNTRSGAIERVSVSTAGGEGNGHSYTPAISADGRYVAFVTDSSNIVDPVGGIRFIALRDRETGETELVGAATGKRTAIEKGAWVSICAEGRNVAFHSESPHLTPDDEISDWGVYLWQKPMR